MDVEATKAALAEGLAMGGANITWGSLEGPGHLLMGGLLLSEMSDRFVEHGRGLAPKLRHVRQLRGHVWSNIPGRFSYAVWAA